MPQAKPPDNSFIKFSQNLRTTATGTRFVKQLFTNPTSLSPLQITTVLKALGLDIPRDVMITAQLAQIMISGNSIYQGYQVAQTAEQAASLNKMSFQNAQAAIGLVRELKWVDRGTASQLIVAADVAMLIASCGTDISSWVSLACEASAMGNAAQAEAKQLANQGIRDWVDGSISAQSRALQESAARLSNNEIGVFGFLTESSVDSSMLFEQSVVHNPALQPIRDLLPTLDLFPIYTGTVISSSRTETWYGEGHRDEARLDYRTTGLLGATKADAARYIFNNVFKPLLVGYKSIQDSIIQKQKCPLYEYSKLVALDNESFYLENKLDIQEKFKRQFLTPHDLGFDLFSRLNEYGPQKAVSGTAVKTVLTKETPIVTVIDADKKGFINPILKNTQSRKIIDEFFNYSSIEFPTTFGKDSRDMANFIAYMNFLDVIRDDPFFKSLTDVNYINEYVLYGHVGAWKEEVKRLAVLTQVRKVNKLARENIASYFNISSDKLIKIDSNQIDTPSVFKIKG